MHNYRIPLMVTMLFSSILHLYCAESYSYLLVAEDGSSVMTDSPITKRSEYFKKQLEDPHSSVKDGHAEGPLVIPVPVCNEKELHMLKDILALDTKKEIHSYLNNHTKAHNISDGGQHFTLEIAYLSGLFAITEMEKFLGIAVSLVHGADFPAVTELTQPENPAFHHLISGYNHMQDLYNTCVEANILLDIVKHPRFSPISTEKLPSFITVRDFIEFRECTTGPLDLIGYRDYPWDTPITQGFELAFACWPIKDESYCYRRWGGGTID